MSTLEAPASPFPPRPPWSGIGADGWDGTVCPDDLRLISASSVPKALHSRALEDWALGETVRGIGDNLGEFQTILGRDGMDAAIDWAKELRWRPKEGHELNAADAGTAMHSLLEAWLRGDAPDPQLVETIQRDESLVAMAGNLWNWYQRFRPVAVALEQVVYDPVNGLAGRLDAIVRFDAAPQLGTVLLDLKNSREARTKGGYKKRPYGDSQALQLAVYRNCPYVATFEPRIHQTERKSSTRVYLLNPREIEACQPMWQIDTTAIVQNNPEGCALYPMNTGPAVHRRALEAAGMHRWLNQESRDVVGDPFLPAIPMPELT